MHDCPKLGVVAEIFFVQSADSAEVFDRGIITRSRLQIARGRRLCHIVDGGRERYGDYFENKAFSIFVQLAFKYRQNNMHCTPLSPHSGKHQQRARIIAGLLPSGHSKLVSGR